MASRALVIGGLTSGSGKTTVTLGLLRALADKGVDIGAAKTGPDYIDCAFLAAASRTPAVNLDRHAMPQALIRRLAAERPRDVLVVEGVMGLFDGTHGGSGSTAQLAAALGAPILLILDTRHQGQTAAALAAGIETQLPAGTSLAGVVLNRIASPRHEELIREELEARSITCFGSLKSDPTISVPSRHLGLVQAADLAAQGELEPKIDAAAKLVAGSLDLEALMAVMTPLAEDDGEVASGPPQGSASRWRMMPLSVLPTHTCWKDGGPPGPRSCRSRRSPTKLPTLRLISYSCLAAIRSCICRPCRQMPDFWKACDRQRSAASGFMASAAAS